MLINMSVVTPLKKSDLLSIPRNTHGTRSQLVGTLESPKVDEDGAKARHTFLGSLDAIACGIEAWFEENTGYSRKVAETTVEIARALGVPESDIKRWVSRRSIRDMEKGRVISSLLQRLQESSCCVDSGEHLREAGNQPSSDPGVSRRGK